MGDIGLICLGHADYINENFRKMTSEVEKQLQRFKIYNQKIQTIAINSELAIKQARELRNNGCRGVILFLASWVECRVVMSALKELQGMPVILWGTTIEEIDGKKLSTGSYVSAAMMNGVIRRLNMNCHCLIGSHRDEKILKRLVDFTCAARAAWDLKYGTVGLVGYTSMGIYPGTFDHVLMRYKVGPEIDQTDSYSVICRAERTERKKLEAARRNLDRIAVVAPEVHGEILDKTLSLYCALKEMCEEYRWDAVNVKCQYEFSKEYKAVPCVALSLLADDGIVASCEGDIPNTVSMMILKSIAGKAVTYGDAITHWGNTVKFSACGFLPFSMGCGQRSIRKFLEHPGFSGIQTSFVMRPERVTFLRLVEDIGSYHLLYGTGQGLVTELRDGCMPALDVQLDGDIDTLVHEYAGQHFALCYGDIAGAIEEYAILMGMKSLRI